MKNDPLTYYQVTTNPVKEMWTEEEQMTSENELDDNSKIIN